jgi:hypothetical protein
MKEEAKPTQGCNADNMMMRRRRRQRSKRSNSDTANWWHREPEAKWFLLRFQAQIFKCSRQLISFGLQRIKSGDLTQ